MKKRNEKPIDDIFRAIKRVLGNRRIEFWIDPSKPRNKRIRRIKIW